MSDVSIKKKPGMFARVRRLERKVGSTSSQWLEHRVDTLERQMVITLRNNTLQMNRVDQLACRTHSLIVLAFVVVFAVIYKLSTTSTSGK